MKNLILAIFASMALLCATFSTSAIAKTESEVNILAPQDNPHYVVVYQNGCIITYEYDGPGGKLVNVYVESLE